MKIALVRIATIILELRGRRILVDPMLNAAGARPPIDGTANPVRNPTVELPIPAEDVVRGLDETAERLLPRDLPVFCQPEDEERLRAIGLAPVSGFVLDDLYLAGDTVWYEAIEETIVRFRPRVAVVNAAGESFLDGSLIVMGFDDVREVVARVPVVVAVHLEALNRCHLTRAELRKAIPSVLVPNDGETVEL
jgi:hypothetical protein